VSELHLCADVTRLGMDALRREEFVHRGAIRAWHVSGDAQGRRARAMRKKARDYHAERLLVTLLGYLVSLCAYRTGRRSKKVYSLERMAREVLALAPCVYAERHNTFTTEVRKRRKRLGYPR
jgi:hypothetical protein